MTTVTNGPGSPGANGTNGGSGGAGATFSATANTLTDSANSAEADGGTGGTGSSTGGNGGSGGNASASATTSLGSGSAVASAAAYGGDGGAAANSSGTLGRGIHPILLRPPGNDRRRVGIFPVTAEFRRNSSTGALEIYDININALADACSAGAVSLHWTFGGVAVLPASCHPRPFNRPRTRSAKWSRSGG